MAYGDWDAVITAYKSYAELQVDTEFQRKFHDHSIAMLSLVPEIRKLPEADQIIVGTTHGTLFFTTDNTPIEFCIWYEDGQYTLYFYAPHEGKYGTDYGEIIVEANNLTSTIREQLQILISL